MNSCNFTGRLTKDPELKTTNSGLSVCSFSLAVQRPKVKETTDFINFVAWRQSAEYLCKYGKKGNVVEVSGTLTLRGYKDSNGNDRTAFEVVADSLKLLSNGNSEAPKETPTENDNSSNTPYSVQDSGVSFEEMSSDDDLPF